MSVAVLDSGVMTEGALDPASFSVSAGSDRALIVITGINGAGDTMDSITYGGQSMSLIVAGNEQTSRRMYAWYLNDAGIAAASGTAFSASYTGGPAGGRIGHTVLSVSGAEQTTPTVTNNAEVTTGAVSASITGVADALAFVGVRSTSTGVDWAWTTNGETELTDSTVITANDDAAAYKAMTDGSSYTLGPDNSGTDDKILVCFRVSPVASGSFTTTFGGPTFHGGIR